MNNFVFSQDPLLFQSYQTKPAPMEETEAKQRQMNDIMMHLQSLQNSQYPQQERGKDHLGDLDVLLKGLRKDLTEKIMKNDEYLLLNQQLQEAIQTEIMSNIKWKINSNPSSVKIIEKLTNLIEDEKKKNDEEERKNIIEINDYMKNYSSITFDEYKKLKNKQT